MPATPPPTPYGRRFNDLPWFCKFTALRWVRRVWPVLVFVGGVAWAEAKDWVGGIPSKDKMAQYDVGLALIPDFYKLQSEMQTVRNEIRADKELSQRQRDEILRRLDTLDDRLSRWFEKAAKTR